MRRGVPSRSPLVPKELIVPVCQRLAFVLITMCGTALGIRLWSLFKEGRLGAFSYRMQNHVNGTHFFLDIGSGNSGFQGPSYSKTLEKNGWKGVCTDPFPELGRSCTSLAMAVTAKTGELVELPDCRGLSSPLQVLLSTEVDNCPKVSQAGVSVVDILKLSKAPKVVDFVNLDTRGTELAILGSFPFEDYCVRSWTIQLRDTAKEDPGGKGKALLVARRCKVEDFGSSYWARCPCTQFAESLLHKSIATHETGDRIVRAGAATMTASGKQQRKRKGASVAMVNADGSARLSAHAA